MGISSPVTHSFGLRGMATMQSVREFQFFLLTRGVKIDDSHLEAFAQRLEKIEREGHIGGWAPQNLATHLAYEHNYMLGFSPHSDGALDRMTDIHRQFHDAESDLALEG